MDDCITSSTPHSGPYAMNHIVVNFIPRGVKLICRCITDCGDRAQPEDPRLHFGYSMISSTGGEMIPFLQGSKLHLVPWDLWQKKAGNRVW